MGINSKISISSHVSQTEYQSACRRVKLLMLPVVRGESEQETVTAEREDES